MFTVNLNTESAMVLLRCLEYGASAISKEEAANGVSDMLQLNIEFIRKQVCRELYKEYLPANAKKST